ncbi:hypothetical protein M5K25_022420 [Dendrobium thyrsiflorum]|uniref:Uncharacterized protein n=1 Tax=Dendrobium thyrsiflorum TaxID=117978 RepID=A0ABD0UCA5_DENTH
MSSMEGQVADLRDMMKKMLEFQTQSAASDAKGPEAKNTNSEIRREEKEVEIVEGRRGRPHLEPFQREERGGYGERQGYGGVEPRGAGWEHREGYYGRRGAVFEDRRGDSEAKNQSQINPTILQLFDDPDAEPENTIRVSVHLLISIKTHTLGNKD